MVQPVYCPRCGAMPIRGGWSWHLSNECTRKWPDVQQPNPVKGGGGSMATVLLTFFVLAALFLLAGWVRADTLTPVAPPTDWTGVGVVAFLAAVFVAIAAYVIHIRKTPGLQLGEEQIERIAELLHRKQNPPPVTATAPIIYDGKTFPDQAEADAYKAAKAIVDSAKGA